jgi:hypothetical protein
LRGSNWCFSRASSGQEVGGKLLHCTIIRVISSEICQSLQTAPKPVPAPKWSIDTPDCPIPATKGASCASRDCNILHQRAKTFVFASGSETAKSVNIIIFLNALLTLALTPPHDALQTTD